MPPSQDDPRPNPIAGPGDYTTTSIVHNDTYPAIYPTAANATNKSVFIAGASKGIGRATALSFARSGASSIAIAARSSLDAVVGDLRAAAQKAGRQEPKILPVKLDVSDRESVEAAAKTVEKDFGGLDVLIINAGLLDKGMITDMNPDAWWRIWETNVKGPYLMARSFVPIMLKGGEKTIVTVSSVGAHAVMPGLSAYQTGKLAVLRLMEFVCAEYGDQGVLAYSIHPGNVADTSIMGGEEIPKDLQHIFVETPELAADTLTFLTREKRSWLARRYINATWDMPELMAKEQEIEGTDKLKVRMVLAE